MISIIQNLSESSDALATGIRSESALLQGGVMVLSLLFMLITLLYCKRWVRAMNALERAWFWNAKGASYIFIAFFGGLFIYACGLFVLPEHMTNWWVHNIVLPFFPWKYFPNK